jgi:hypothetical protein
MKTEEAVKIFGSVRQLADAIGISEQAVYKWGENVPELRRYQIEALAKEKSK